MVGSHSHTTDVINCNALKPNMTLRDCNEGRQKKGGSSCRRGRISRLLNY